MLQLPLNMLAFDVATQAELDAVSTALGSRLTALEALPSMVRVNTANGYGSTNTRIRRFANITNGVNGAVIQGTDITVADSAANSTSFTVNTSGVYAMTWNDNFTLVDAMALTSNVGAGNLDIRSVPLSSVYAYDASSGANAECGVSATVYLAAGTVVWCRTLLSGSAGSSTGATFTMVRVA